MTRSTQRPRRRPLYSPHGNPHRRRRSRLRTELRSARHCGDGVARGGRVQGSGFSDRKKAGFEGQESAVSPPPASRGVRAPGPPGAFNLHERLQPAPGGLFHRPLQAPAKNRRPHAPALGTRLAIADSKQLYKPGLGLEQLERGVLAVLVATSPEHANCVAHVKALLAATLADPHGRRFELDCHAGDELPLPLDALAEEICELAALLRKSCAASGVTLLAVRARLIYPAEFNELVDRHGTKGAALSHVTLALVREVVDASMKPRGTSPPARTLPPDSCPLTPDSCSITLDKHGGRNRYAAILQHHFPDSWIEVIDEGRSASRYRWKHGAAPIEAIFRVGGEVLLPTAPRVDDRQVPSRGGDAGLQRVLDHPPPRPQADGRLPQRCEAFSRTDYTIATRVED